MSNKKPSLLNILSQTSAIIIANSCHFLALSILFIFPNSLAAIIYTFLFAKSQLPIQIGIFLSSYLFNLCAVSCITYATFHGFNGETLNLIASLKSIPVSFFPLLATTLVVHTIIGLIIFGFIVLVLLSYNGLALLGLEMDYNATYFLVLVVAALLIGLTIYLQVELYLVNAAVVLESKWGVAPLKRSWYLVKGMWGVIFLVMMLFAVLSLLSAWFLSVVANARRINDESMPWLVLQVVVYVGISTMLSLYGLAANTVVFVHCKALQTDDEPSVVYVQLPSDVV